MDKYRETGETWNKVATVYEDKFMHLTLYNESYDLICHTIAKPQANLLEIGCGPGNITRYLLSKRPDFNVLGIDVAPNMVALAIKNNPTAHFEVMDCRQIGRLHKKFDGIIAGFCIPYLSNEDSIKLIAAASHLLNDQGLLYISFVEGDPAKSAFQVGSSGDRVYFYYHQLALLNEVLLQHGFECPQVFKVDYETKDGTVEVHTIVIAQLKPLSMG
ncbi:class I SAM-dependent methyltransferase [Pedobacter sp. ASV28]|uniref:class I SAM-dependent DNA methyltransferase n=1 Tax=Pedobacter sp. ASV28 TaxID=2795123 RepID=UPI0018EBF1D1|nr:class I SAM-dependent methyltransferase [Pedobacter sp. ASV28]